MKKLTVKQEVIIHEYSGNAYFESQNVCKCGCKIRYSKFGRCVDCNRMKSLKGYYKDRDRCMMRNREYQENNKERILEQRAKKIIKEMQ